MHQVAIVITRKLKSCARYASRHHGRIEAIMGPKRTRPRQADLVEPSISRGSRVHDATVAPRSLRGPDGNDLDVARTSSSFGSDGPDGGTCGAPPVSGQVGSVTGQVELGRGYDEPRTRAHSNLAVSPASDADSAAARRPWERTLRACGEAWIGDPIL